MKYMNMHNHNIESTVVTTLSLTAVGYSNSFSNMGLTEAAKQNKDYQRDNKSFGIFAD